MLLFFSPRSLIRPTFLTHPSRERSSRILDAVPPDGRIVLFECSEADDERLLREALIAAQPGHPKHRRNRENRSDAASRLRLIPLCQPHPDE